MSVILGIDPGTRFTGWGVLSLINSQTPKYVNSGTFTLPDKEDLGTRLAILLEKLDALIISYQVEFIAVEKLFFAKNADSAFKLGHARGVVMALAGKHKLKTKEYAARSVKKNLTGSGAASKEQVQFWVSKICEKNIESLDASDALALALFCARDIEVDQIWGRQNIKNQKTRDLEG